MKMKNTSRFTLDIAGKLYSSTISERSTTLYKLSVYLQEHVDEKVLQKAQDNLIGRFPYYHVVMKKGMFWHYLEQTAQQPAVEKETCYPCMSFRLQTDNDLLFKILYGEKKISVEFSHILTDGNGAMVFLLSLVAEYLKLQGVNIHNNKGLYTPDQKVNNGEIENSYRTYAKNNIPINIERHKAFKLPFEKIELGRYNVVIGTVPSKEFRRVSKNRGATVTEFASAILTHAIYEFMMEHNLRKKPIVVNVPVNLRRLYRSVSMKNFFVSVTPGIDPRMGAYTFEDILNEIACHLKRYLRKEHLDMHIKKRVQSEEHWLKFLPLFMKNWVMPLGRQIWGESNYTIGFSNMGRVVLPPEMEAHIEDIEAIPPPSKGLPINMAMIIFKDKMHITFGKSTDNTEIEGRFFTKLRELGIPFTLATNYGRAKNRLTEAGRQEDCSFSPSQSPAYRFPVHGSSNRLVYDTE